MRPLLRTSALVLLALAGAGPAVAQQWIADIKAVPQRHVNREVTIEGQVMATTPNPPGTTRGTYLVVDDSDPQGIAVRTKNLPPAGREYRVTGTVIQDAATATFLIDEIGRGPVGRPAWLLPGLIGLGVLVLLLLWALVRAMRGGRPAPAYAGAPVPPMAAPTAAPTIRPTTAPPPLETIRPTGPPSGGDATDVLSVGDETEVYRSLGAAFKVTGGPDAGREFPIGRTTVLIGRSGRRRNDITLSDSAISREQARLVYSAETKTFTLINESLTNPTRVDGVEINAKELSDGSVIEMGKTKATLVRS
jgi:hypothetical protein